MMRIDIVWALTQKGYDDNMNTSESYFFPEIYFFEVYF